MKILEIVRLVIRIVAGLFAVFLFGGVEPASSSAGSQRLERAAVDGLERRAA